MKIYIFTMCYSILMSNPSTSCYSSFHNLLQNLIYLRKKSSSFYTIKAISQNTFNLNLSPLLLWSLHGRKALISWARPFWFIKVNAITLNPTQETTGNCCGLWHIVVKCSLPLISGIAHAVKFPPEIAASRMHCSCLISG